MKQKKLLELQKNLDIFKRHDEIIEKLHADNTKRNNRTKKAHEKIELEYYLKKKPIKSLRSSAYISSKKEKRKIDNQRDEEELFEKLYDSGRKPTEEEVDNYELEDNENLRTASFGPGVIQPTLEKATKNYHEDGKPGKHKKDTSTSLNKSINSLVKLIEDLSVREDFSEEDVIPTQKEIKKKEQQIKNNIRDQIIKDNLREKIMQNNLSEYEYQDYIIAKSVEEKNSYRANYMNSKELYVRPMYEHLNKKPSLNKITNEDDLEQSFQRIDFILNEDKKRPKQKPNKWDSHVLAYPKYFNNPLFKPKDSHEGSQEMKQGSVVLPSINIYKPEDTKKTTFADHRSQELRQIMSSKDFGRRIESLPKIQTSLTSSEMGNGMNEKHKQKTIHQDQEYEGTYQEKRKLKAEVLKKVANEHGKVLEQVEKARIKKSKISKHLIQNPVRKSVDRTAIKNNGKGAGTSHKNFDTYSSKGIDHILKQYDAIEEEGGEIPSQGTIKFENSGALNNILYDDDYA